MGARSLMRLTVLIGTAFVLLAPAANAQSLSYTQGQGIAAAYEGWERAEDGQLFFMFGYMNRNWEEELDIPVGSDNFFTPGIADRGQPTHFLPRRNRFIFRVPVPDGFTEDDEMSWTLTAHGETDVAYASLRPDYFVDNVVIMSETGALGAGTSSPEIRANIPPVIELETPRELEARVGEPVRIVARITDDGVPNSRGSNQGADDDDDEEDEPATPAEEESADEDEEELSPAQIALREHLRPPTRVTVGKVNGLFFSWFVYRGTDAVTFDPIQINTWENTRAGANSPWAPRWKPPVLPADGRWVVNATFHEPGVYVLQGRADDGGLYSDERITVRVSP